MHLRHVQVHRRADGLFGFGNIAHEIDVSSDVAKRHVEKREPRKYTLNDFTITSGTCVPGC